MNRTEAIKTLNELIPTVTASDKYKIRQVIEFIEEPTTLAEFLGWKEGQEYEYEVNDAGATEIARILNNDFQVYSNLMRKYIENAPFYPEDIEKMRQAKKVEPKLKAYHVKDEYSFKCLIKELEEKGYTKTLGGFLTIKTSYFNSVKETTRNYIYLHDNDRVSFSHELVRDGYDIIEYHKEEPKYYAKIKGNDLLNSNFVYVNYNTISERLALGINSERGNWKTNFTKKEWKNLGVTDENFDFNEVEM